MSYKIFFSVIVPIYNAEKYLKRCIDSILAQTYPYFELILVNDGSTDICRDICEDYCKKDNRIVLINQENQGLLAARRVGIRRAKGDYFVHVDSDDYCDKTLLEKICNKILETDCDLILYGCLIIRSDGTTLRRVPMDVIDPGNDEYISKESIIRVIASSYALNNLVIKCAKHSIVDVTDDYSQYGRLMMSEDLLQSIPLIDNAERIAVINLPLYMYCIHGDSMSRRLKKQYIYDELIVRKKVYKMIKKYCDDASVVNKFGKFYYHRLVSYMVKSTTVYSSREYKKMIDDIKQNYIIKDLYASKKYMSVIELMCYELAISKQYFICKIFAKIFYATFR